MQSRRCAFWRSRLTQAGGPKWPARWLRRDSWMNGVWAWRGPLTAGRQRPYRGPSRGGTLPGGASRVVSRSVGARAWSRSCLIVDDRDTVYIVRNTPTQLIHPRTVSRSSSTHPELSALLNNSACLAARNSTWWSRPPDNAHDLGLGDGSTPIHDSSPRAASARMALTAGARRRLRRRDRMHPDCYCPTRRRYDRMHPDCYCPARRLPSFPSGALLMAGSGAQHGAFHRFPWALCWACPGATPQRQGGQTRTLGTRAVSKDALRVTNP